MLNNHKNAIIELVDSFRKMCDFIEYSENIGCEKCPVFSQCFYTNKHGGLRELMDDLKIKY